MRWASTQAGTVTEEIGSSNKWKLVIHVEVTDAGARDFFTSARDEDDNRKPLSFHLFIGGALVLVGLLTLIEVLGDLSSTALRFVTPLAAGVMGLGGLLWLWVHASGDPIHFLIGVALVAGAGATGLGRRAAQPSLATESMAPLSYFITGALFLSHGADGVRELLLHAGIGGLLGLAGAALLSPLLAASPERTMRVFGALLVLCAGLLLTIHDVHL